MPEGQFTGVRKTYIYNSDNNEATYLITTDATLGDLAGAGLTEATTATAAASKGQLPRGYKPRVVFWQGELNDRMVRKEIICGSTAAALYNSVAPQNLTVDGVAGSTTGRRGEKVRFLKLAPAAGGGGGT